MYTEHGSANSTKNISKTPQHKTAPAKQQTTSTGYQISEKETQELKGSATTSTQSLSRTLRNYNKKYGGVDTTKTRTKLRGENETRNTPSTCKVAGAGKATQTTQRSHYPKLPQDEFENTHEKKKDWYKTIITPATIFTKEEAANEKEHEIKQQGDLENEKDNRSKQHTALKEDLTNNDKESQAKVELQRNRQHTKHNEYTNKSTQPTPRESTNTNPKLTTNSSSTAKAKSVPTQSERKRPNNDNSTTTSTISANLHLHQTQEDETQTLLPQRVVIQHRELILLQHRHGKLSVTKAIFGIKDSTKKQQLRKWRFKEES